MRARSRQPRDLGAECGFSSANRAALPLQNHLRTMLGIIPRRRDQAIFELTTLSSGSVNPKTSPSLGERKKKEERMARGGHGSSFSSYGIEARGQELGRQSTGRPSQHADAGRESRTRTAGTSFTPPSSAFVPSSPPRRPAGHEKRNTQRPIIHAMLAAHANPESARHLDRRPRPVCRHRRRGIRALGVTRLIHFPPHHDARLGSVGGARRSKSRSEVCDVSQLRQPRRAAPFADPLQVSTFLRNSQ